MQAQSQQIMYMNECLVWKARSAEIFAIASWVRWIWSTISHTQPGLLITHLSLVHQIDIFAIYKHESALFNRLRCFRRNTTTMCRTVQAIAMITVVKSDSEHVTVWLNGQQSRQKILASLNTNLMDTQIKLGINLIITISSCPYHNIHTGALDRTGTI